MSRLVVVSNRLADPRKTAAGGLAVALAEVLNATGGMWFGWSGKLVEATQGGVAGEGRRASGVRRPVGGGRIGRARASFFPAVPNMPPHHARRSGPSQAP